MTTDTIPIVGRRVQRGLLYTAGLAAVWLIAAAVRPEVTYHLAPILVAGSLPVAMVLDCDRAPGMKVLVLASGVGFVVAVATAALLAVAGWMEGPPFGAFATAGGESIAGAAFGAVAGLLLAALWRR